MELRSYFRRIREIEGDLEAGDHLMVSLATPDGGREGVMALVPRRQAAELIVARRGRLATQDEADRFEMEQAVARRSWEEAELSRRVQVQVVREMDRGSGKDAKG